MLCSSLPLGVAKSLLCLAWPSWLCLAWPSWLCLAAWPRPRLFLSPPLEPWMTYS